MNTHPYAISRTLIVSAFLLVASTGWAQRSQEKVVAVSFTLPSSHVTLHEPVYVRFAVHNGLPGPISFDLGKNGISNFGFTIVDQRGVTHQVGPLSGPPFAAPGKVQLRAGESFDRNLLLNRWYQFPAPGMYELKPRMTSIIEAKTGAVNPEVHPVNLTVHVGSRNPGQLEKVCAQLAAAASTPALGLALEPAHTLSYVIDPVAVPYLAKIAERGEPFRSIALEGLGRIARADGLEAVYRRLGANETGLRTAVKQEVYNQEHNVRAMD